MVVHDGGVAFRALSLVARRSVARARGRRWRVHPRPGDPRRFATSRLATGCSLVFRQPVARLRRAPFATRDTEPSRSSTSRRARCVSCSRSSAPTTSLGSPLAVVAGRPLVPGADERRPTVKRFVRIDAATGDAVDIAPMHHLGRSRGALVARIPGGSPTLGPTTAVRARHARARSSSRPRILATAVAITDPTKLAWGPAWSPDGAWIAFGSATLIRSVAEPWARADGIGADAVDRAARWPGPS